MNSFFANSYQVREGNFNMGGLSTKKGFPFGNQASESLFGMAFYDFEGGDFSASHAMAGTLPRSHVSPPVFHPVDEYKDLSLREILDLSDDFLSNDDQLLGNVPPPSDFHHAMNTVSLDHGSLSQPDSTLSRHQQPPVLSNDVSTFTPKKRSREFTEEAQMSMNDNSSTCSGKERRFRPYQAGQWSEKFQELCDYRDEFGHCLVPHTYNENLALARWVKRQRYQYKLMIEAKSSTMTQDRVTALEDIGFVWDSQGAAWGERLGELLEFKKAYHHCNVPSNFSENPRLATWIKCQRRQYKLFMENKPSNMTSQRTQHLEKLGFEWELRSYKKQRTE
jgi:Helicase associated domain